MVAEVADKPVSGTGNGEDGANGGFYGEGEIDGDSLGVINLVAVRKGMESVRGKFRVGFSGSDAGWGCWWFNRIILVVKVEKLGGGSE